MIKPQVLKVYGPPGCGKTSTALALIKRLSESGQRVAFSSFTRKARNEATERLGAFPGKVKIKTLHSFAYNVLNYQRHYVLSNPRKFAQEMGEETTDDRAEHDLDEDINMEIPVTEFDEMLRLYDTERNLRRPLEPHEFPSRIDPRRYRAFVQRYCEYKDAQFYVDFTDMTVNAIKAGHPLEADVFFVDEAQDLTPLQWEAVFVLAQNCQTIIALGDDDQSVYGWMGSDPDTFMNLKADQSVVLSKSFRVPKTIHRYTKTILGRMKKRYEKIFAPTERKGRIYATHAIDYESDIAPYDSVVILYRNHFMAKDVRASLKADGIAYRGPHSPWERKDDLEAIRVWERWRRGAPITVRDAKRCQSRLHRQYRLQELDSLSGDEKAPRCPSKKPWYDVLRVHFKQSYEIVQERHGIEALYREPILELSSIHHAKGGEWDKVILVTDMTKATHDAYLNGGAELEHRVWYVALTRARKDLQILSPKTPLYYPLEGVA